MNRHNQDASTLRAALYMRVSTGRQIEHDLSIPDQRTHLKSWCRTHGYTVAAEFVEGASAGDDRRPVFQQMIERACRALIASSFTVIADFSERPSSRNITCESLRSTGCASFRSRNPSAMKANPCRP